MKYSFHYSKRLLRFKWSLFEKISIEIVEILVLNQLALLNKLLNKISLIRFELKANNYFLILTPITFPLRFLILMDNFILETVPVFA